MPPEANPTKYTFFVSSTRSDLKQVRPKVFDTILSAHHIPVAMEHFSGTYYRDNIDQIKAEIDKCDYFILIIGSTYGSKLNGPLDAETKKQLSYTQQEFQHASMRKIPMIVIVPEDPANFKVKKLEKTATGRKQYKEFIDEVTKANKGVKFWKTELDIVKHVSDNIPHIIRDHPRLGWRRDLDHQYSNPGLASSLSSSFGEIRSAINTCLHKNEGYRTLISDWMLDGTAKDVQRISTNPNFSIQVQQPFERIRQVLGEVLMRMKKGDRYNTVSTLDFWMNDFQGERTFIDSNINALARGVIIDRVLVLSPDVFDQPKSHMIQLSQVDSLISMFERSALLLRGAGAQLTTRFLLADLEKQDFKTLPIAILYNEDKYQDMLKTNRKLDETHPFYQDYMHVHPNMSSAKSSNIDDINFEFADRQNFSRMIQLHDKVQDVMERPDLLSIDDIKMKLVEAGREVNYSLVKQVVDVKRLVVRALDGSFTVVRAKLAPASREKVLPYVRIGIHEGDAVYTIVDEASEIENYEKTGLITDQQVSTGSDVRSIFLKSLNWRMFMVEVPNGLAVYGFIQLISGIFADEGISICLFSVADAEFLLVREPDWGRALTALAKRGIEVNTIDRGPSY